MTASTLEHATATSSRRALLAGALGGIGAWAASAIGRASPVSGADGDAIHVGDSLSASSATKLTNNVNVNPVLWGVSEGSGTGIRGTTVSGNGVFGSADTGAGVRGLSNSYYGVYGFSASNNAIVGRSIAKYGVRGVSDEDVGVYGESTGGAPGVYGTSSDTGVYGTSTGIGIGVEGSCNAGTGVRGSALSGTGVYGSSESSIGVYGFSSSGIALMGFSLASDKPAVVGRSIGHRTAVMGYSGTGSLPPEKAKTGMYGYAAQDSSAKGVWGETTSGHAVHGTATSGYAGYFAGKVYTSTFHELQEISAPGAPASNRARLFVRDNGSGKTQLCVRFSAGAVKVLVTQA